MNPSVTVSRLDLSLCLSLFLHSALASFLLYPEIRNSDWGESFAQFFLIKLAFLRQKNSSNRLTRGPRGSGARLPGVGVGPTLVATSGTVSR